MESNDSFELVNASHARRSDGMEVYFKGRHEVVYVKNGELLTMTIETIINSKDLAPDGGSVALTPNTRWEPSNREVSADEWQTLQDDMNAAAVPLRTRFEFDTYGDVSL